MPTLNSEKWHEVKEIFYAALQRAPAERERFLDESCNGDDRLRREVESLLASSDSAGSFMQNAAVCQITDAIAGNMEKLHVSQSLSHYKILRLLGTGGMGEVYLAEDTRLDRLVAFKILNEKFEKDEANLKRFIREAKAASALNHPNILTIYEIGEADDAHFIVSEYIEGNTLREVFREKTLTLAEVLEISFQIANALTAAHTAHIVHRDIKPENIIIRPDGLAKILDFGLAKLVEQKAVGFEASTVKQNETAKGVILGTINYMSPEQAKAQKIDERTDIFSFGVLVYEMIAGRTPFAGDSVSETLANLINKEPPPISRLTANAPDELQRIVSKMLRKNRDERYQTMKGLLADLKELRENLAFDEKLERSQPPNDNATQILQATTNDLQKQTAAPHGFSRTIRQKPVAAAALLALVVGAIGFWFFAGRTKQIESIAVLPFVNEGGNQDTEYLSDGITETLIGSLTQLPNLNVKSRSSVFRYKGKETNAQTVGKELNVQAILLGRVVQRGEDLTLFLSLVDAATENNLWSKQYNRKLTNLVALQTEIAHDVAEHLKTKLSGADEQQLAKNYTENAEAYQFYLRGRYFWNKRNADGIKKAIEQFQQAIDRDPNYALGYVGLADSYLFLHEFANSPASEMLPKARAAADRALQLDDSLSEAHTSSALIYRFLWRWAEAEEEFKRAVSLNPNNSTAHQWFSILHRNKRQFDDALREIKRAQEIDPLSTLIGANISYIYILKGDLDSAVEQSKKMLELDPNFALTHELLGIAYLKQQRYQEATAEFEKAVELSGRANSRYLSSLAYCYAVTGRRAEALAILKEIEKKYTEGEANGQNLAGVYAGFGDKNQAFVWLEKDFEQRKILLPEITWRFAFENLRSDSHYADLVRRMGLTP